MALHTVQQNQSAASIAQMYTGNPAREKELVRANLHKGYRQTRNGNLYFTSLQAGEKLRLPLSWMKKSTVKNPMPKTTNGAVAQSRLQGLINAHNMGVGGVVGVGQDQTSDITSSGDDTGDSGDSSVTNQNLTNVDDSATVANNTANGSLDSNGNLTCAAGYTLAVDTNGNNYCAPNSTSSGGSGGSPSPGPSPSPSPTPTPVTSAGGTDWLLWGGVALGVVAVGGGLYYFSKKGHKPAMGPGSKRPGEGPEARKSTELFYR